MHPSSIEFNATMWHFAAIQKYPPDRKKRLWPRLQFAKQNHISLSHLSHCMTLISSSKEPEAWKVRPFQTVSRDQHPLHLLLKLDHSQSRQKRNGYGHAQKPHSSLLHYWSKAILLPAFKNG
jgi:hypothetical protein